MFVVLVCVRVHVRMWVLRYDSFAFSKCLPFRSFFCMFSSSPVDGLSALAVEELVALLPRQADGVGCGRRGQVRACKR